MDLQQTLKQLNNDFRQAQSLMFNGKKEESAAMIVSMLKTTEEGLNEFPAEPGLSQSRDKILKLKADLLRRGIKFGDEPGPQPEKPVVTGTDAEQIPVPSSSGAAPTPIAVEKLPQAVERRLRIVAEAIQKNDFPMAEQCMKEIASGYQGQFIENHPLYIDISHKYEAFARAQNPLNQKHEPNTVSAAADEEQSLEWLHKLNRLPCLLTPSPELSVIRQKKEEFEQVKSTLDLCRNQSFEKADFLKQKETEIEQMLDEFPATLTQMTDMAAMELIGNIRQKMNYLQQNQNRSFETGSRELPVFVSQSELEEFRLTLEALTCHAEHNPAAVENALRDWKLLLQANAEAHEMRKHLVVMRPAKYTGDDISLIEVTAIKLVGRQNPGMIPLKTSVVSESWTEESGWKYTDGTQTQTVFETTRSLTAEVAAKDADGKVLLFTLNIEKKKTAGGDWSLPGGNIMYSEEMTESNV